MKRVETAGQGVDLAAKRFQEQPPTQRAGLQDSPCIRSSVGQGADLAVRMLSLRHASLRFTVILLLLLSLSCPAGASDLIRLRDGREITGRIIQTTSDGYVVSPSKTPSKIQRIPRKATAFILYADQTKAADLLNLDNMARNRTKAPAPDEIRLLAAEPFGKALLEAVQSATDSIWISAYYFKDSRASPIRDFYTTLREKASAGVEVVILAENSTASPPAMRRANANFAAELARDGIQTLLWSETNKALHKKLVIVDGRILLLGSSNLSLSGTYGSIEMNILTEAPHLVQAAIDDFADLRTQINKRQDTP